MGYKIKSRIWIESEDKVLLGEGRVHLLKAIQEMGSLSKAAKSLNISYKKAWQLLDSVNKSAKNPVTINSIGGKGGGGRPDMAQAGGNDMANVKKAISLVENFLKEL